MSSTPPRPPSSLAVGPPDGASDPDGSAKPLGLSAEASGSGRECLDLSGIAHVAGVLADPSRARMCVALLDDRAWTIGQLAKHCGVAPSTASEHVAKLAEAALVERVKLGRRVYVRLAEASTAALLEGLAAHAAVLRDGRATL